MYTHGSTVINILLYVDDIILTGNSTFFLRNLISALSHQSAMKDLGDFLYYLGVQVIQPSQDMFLSQQKYVHHLI